MSPSFFEGMARAFDIGGTMDDYDFPMTIPPEQYIRRLNNVVDSQHRMINLLASALVILGIMAVVVVAVVVMTLTGPEQQKLQGERAHSQQEAAAR